MLIKDGRFGLQCKASLKCIDILESATEYLDCDKKCQNEVARLLRSLLSCPLVHFELTIEVLVGFHLQEPFLGIILDKQPRPNHLQLKIIYQNHYKQMMEPIDGITFSIVVTHALPALADGAYKKSWMEVFKKHLERYDANKVDSCEPS